MSKEIKYYHYINIMNFGGIDKRVGCEVSLYELPDSELNTIINNYMIRFKVDEDLYQKIYKLLYEREELKKGEMKNDKRSNN